MKYTDLSIDLETLSTSTNAVITQIGLCAFDSDSGTWRSTSTKIAVDPQDCIQYGMDVSWSTIAWWLKQSEAARIPLAEQAGVSLWDAMRDAVSFINLHCYDGFFPWGHGATFDVVLMENAFRKVKLQCPWSYRNVRDVRTLLNLRPCTHVQKVSPRIEHDAQCDAEAQARWVFDCMGVING